MKKTNENNEAASCEIKREGDENYTKIEKLGVGFPYVITQKDVYKRQVLVQMFYFISRKTGIGFRKFSFDREINKEMILNGSSEFIGEMASAISMFMFNYVLMKYVGAEGVAAFTILG